MAIKKTIDVKKVSKLANLPLSKQEVDTFQKQLSSIIAFIEQLNEVDTKDVKPTSQTTGLENVTRLDLVKAETNLDQAKAISGTEEVHNGYFVVPAILTKEDK